MPRLRWTVLAALTATCAIALTSGPTRAEPQAAASERARVTPNPTLLSPAVYFPFSTSTSSATMGGRIYLPSCQRTRPVRCGLFRTDAVSAPTPVKTHPGAVEDVQVFGATADRVFYAVGYDLRLDAELWASDGTAAGTHLVLDAMPQAFQVVGDEVAFYASRKSTWYRSDGTVAGTRPMPEPASPWDDGRYVDRPFSADAKVAWVSGGSLTVSDGTRAGTMRVDPDLDRFVNVASYDYQPGPWIGGINVFVVRRELDESTGEEQRELWRTDGTSAGTWKIRDIAQGWPRHVVGHDGRAFYVARNRLWTTDGTARGTQPVAIPTRVRGSKVTGVGLPMVMNGRPGVPIHLAARGHGWREVDKAAAVGELSGATVTEIGPILPVDPSRGTWLGSRLVTENDELDLVDRSNTVRWYTYDATRPFVGQPSRVAVRLPRAVRATGPVRVSVWVTSRVLPYSPTSRVVIKRGKRTLASQPIRRNYSITMTFPAKKLGKGKQTITVQYRGDWRVSSSPVVRRTISVR